MPTEHIQRCLQFLRNSPYATVATVSPEGEPQAATIVYLVDNLLNFYFSTRRATRKYRNIAANPNVALTVGAGPEPVTVQVQGVAEELTGERKNDFMVNFFVEQSAYYDIYLKLPGDMDFALYKVTPRWVRMISLRPGEKTEDYLQIIG